MPTYEYRCPACESIVEIIHGVNDPPPRKCPECGARRRLRKQVSAPAFQFKGTGWYVTDYARKDKEGKDKASSTSSEKSAETKSEKSSDSGGSTSGKKSESKGSSSKSKSGEGSKSK